MVIFRRNHCEPLAELFEFCRANNVITILDVAVPQGMQDFGGLERCLSQADYFMPNDDEAGFITGKTDPVAQAKHFRDLGVGTTIITLGERGAIAVQGNDLWRAGVPDIVVVDPSGCGDAFAAGLITAMLQESDIPRMLTVATAVGASCARAVGCYDGIFTAPEAEAFVRDNQIDVEHQTL